ncbi:hypothetical protein ABAC460_04540 [Asticcacaulis sp. AC460]|uniref:hypothetical protein n=1 Tax=Asticcacaulis sp. AC460 TaxID=1282360 RepID=UPI0003C41026|nr:hypothetical protein [Asticcacaulis sp. AC460]ESQ92160.1 hypothetical protein ABAC460_04540 [Asticcacaulis sp. AC460]
MKKAILAVIAACLGCCALLFLIPTVSGVTLVGLRLAGVSLEVLVCALPLVALSGFGLYLVLKPRKACAHDGSCGCKHHDPQAR